MRCLVLLAVLVNMWVPQLWGQTPEMERLQREAPDKIAERPSGARPRNHYSLKRQFHSGLGFRRASRTDAKVLLPNFAANGSTTIGCRQ